MSPARPPPRIRKAPPAAALDDLREAQAFAAQPQAPANAGGQVLAAILRALDDDDRAHMIEERRCQERHEYEGQAIAAGIRGYIKRLSARIRAGELP